MSRRRVIIIWILYGICAGFFLLLQNWLFKHIVIWGVHPEILPFLAVLPAVSQKRRQAMIYAFVLGIFADIVAPVFLPCFFCIVLPLLAFLTGLVSRQIIMSRTFCSVVVCGASLLFIDFCHCIYLLYRGETLLWDALILCGKEFVLSLIVLPLLLFAYGNLSRFIATS